LGRLERPSRLQHHRAAGEAGRDGLEYDLEDDIPHDGVHVDFFNAMTSKDWVRGLYKRVWSADMLVHSTDGRQVTLMGAAQDLNQTSLLTIRQPLVLRHLSLLPSNISGEVRRLMGKRVEIHLSVLVTEADLIAGPRSGEMATVLVFASTVPFVFSGMARFLILRRVKDEGAGRVGRG
jgi:hypothetical protein